MSLFPKKTREEIRKYFEELKMDNSSILDSPKYNPNNNMGNSFFENHEDYDGPTSVGGFFYQNAFDQYQECAASTAIYPKEKGVEYNVLALAGESGEVAGKYSKIIRDNNGELTDEWRTKLFDECSDVLWHLTMLCNDLGYSLRELADYNINKLADRQARGKLSGSGDSR